MPNFIKIHSVVLEIKHADRGIHRHELPVNLCTLQEDIKTETTLQKAERRILPVRKWDVHLCNQMVSKGTTLFVQLHLKTLGPLQDADWKQLAN
jgi:hypothetical protein